jgi:outer membrane protein assembly factor BamB
MMRPARTTLLLSALFALPLALAAAPAEPAKQAQNWPQWRGPLATGAAPEANPPQSWSPTQNIKWKVKVPGRGTSTPIVWGDQVFIQTAIPTGKKAPAAAAERAAAPVLAAPPRPAPGRGRPGGGGMGVPPPTETYQFVLLCLDRQTGKTLWQKVAREELPHEGHHKDHGFSSHSPVTDGKHVYAYFGSRGLHCFDMQGNLKWQKDLGRMQTKMSFGEGSSPALHDDTIVVNWDHEGADFVAAFDKNTGQELWRQPRDEETSWATPLVVEHGGQAQVITCATSKVRSYDLKSGKPLWEVGPMTANVIPTPVAGDGMVYATSGFRGAQLYAIRLGGSGDLAGSNSIAWKHEKATPYVPSPLLYEGKLYFFSGNNGVLSIFDAKTGKPLLDTQRIEGLPRGVYASPVGAGGRVYLVGRDGTTVVIRYTKKLDVLATNALEENVDASPAIAGKELFLRGHEHLYCIAEK